MEEILESDSRSGPTEPDNVFLIEEDVQAVNNISEDEINEESDGEDKLEKRVLRTPRIKKEVQRMVVPVDKKRLLKIPTGTGMKLSEIEHIQNELSKRNAMDEVVQLLHRCMYNRVGENHRRKANIRLFCGFDETVEESNVRQKLMKCPNTLLKDVCVFLNLERGGEKVKHVLFFNSD
jgi:hypothetical protein